MSALKNLINDQEKTYALLIGLFLSVLLLGTAFSSIALGVLTAFSVWQIFKNKYLPKFEFSALLPIFLYGLFVASLLWTINPDLTNRGLGRTLTLIYLPLLIWTMPRISSSGRKYIFEVFTNANCIYALVFLMTSLADFIRTGSLSALTYHELVDILERNAVYVSLYFLVSVIYLLNKEQKTRWDISRMLFLAMMILLLSSKMMIAATVLIFVIHGIFQSRLREIFKPKVLIPAVIIVVIFLLSGNKVLNRFVLERNSDLNEVLTSPQFNRVYPWTGVSFRLLQLRILYEQVQEEDIFWKGFGLFASRDDLAKRHKEFNTYPGYHSYNYHNNYAQVFAESGIFGLLILLAMLFISFWRAAKTKDIFLGYFALILSLVFLTESMMWVHRGLLFMITIYCVLHRSSKTYG